MRKVLMTVLLVGLFVAAGLACTNVVVGKDASVDGSVMTSHTVDGNYDSRIQIIPGGEWPEGTMIPVYKGRLYETIPGRTSRIVGEIPQAPITYTYFHSSYSFMNENGVIIGETTFWGGNAHSNSKGLFDIDELQAFGLNRSTTARECIQVMGALAEKYGYSDIGETLTVIDGNEAWFFEIVGPGPLWEPGSDMPGAVWAAQRVPDDHVSVSANRARIGVMDLNDSDYFMASSNILTHAEEMGFWNPADGPFSFWKAYCPQPYGGRYYQQRREWRVFDLLAPSLNLDPYQVDQYPFSIKPDKKVSVQDVMAIMRDFMEGTEFDLTVGLAAGPFGNPNRYSTPAALRPEEYRTSDWERAISMFRCSYVHIGQARSDMPPGIGSLVWFGHDAPHSTVFIPFYAGITRVPESFSNGTRTYLDRDYAWWAFNYVSNMIDLKFSYIIQDIQALQSEFENEFLTNQPFVEKVAMEIYKESPELAMEYLTNYSCGLANRVVDRWWKLPDEIMFKYYDGFVNLTSVGYPTWWLEAVGYGEGYLEPKH